MRKKVYYILAAIIFFLLAVVALKFFSEKNKNIEQVVGGDKDEHGCIGSAGYSWCEPKQKCLRVWEENCEK